ncbi:MAG TPA: hypothetical protein VLK84_24965 [Longimicrobium sp.]|nr:hypothetical protein [Longimicrobium sp.]
MPHVLPRKHRFAHDYAIFLHDCIVAVLKAGLEARVFDIELDLLPGERKQIAGLKGAALYDWIETNKGRPVTAEMDFREIFSALGADLCHFTLEGLRAAARGKLTVAYALFRKPFKDDLFYLEWLLAGREDFLRRFQHDSPNSIDAGKLTAEHRLRIVTDAALAADAPGVVPQKIFDIRFDRKMNAGFAASWDQAIHLVTTWNHNRTSARNLNFVFSGPDAWETQWANIYWHVPYLLYYTTFVVDQLLSSIADVDESYVEVMWLRRAIGYELWAEYTRGGLLRGPYHSSLDDLLENVDFVCPRCKLPLPSHRRSLKALVIHGTLTCRSCKAATPLGELLAE